ncbi:PAAR domain-containing protein [Herbaspirillum sp. LeCh32-8]|uniref:PAAR domain-containing protein n=1 Tax=Herbaspirillum sp. LeCh32-8 TaxID=2821356 RepID=UPI001AE59447|nr:PAAR domain-containing protein [Herbaspirillum sp. LeCh32-8]MBP0597022.1 PAAR domain-containing protein [Herbaspirillum sp. LeCh32-8]
MSKNIACLGDATSHGGAIISASSTFVLHGKRAALVGDEVSCPRHGNNKIIEGVTGLSEGGRLLVADSCRCACGCVIIAGGSGMEA